MKNSNVSLIIWAFVWRQNLMALGLDLVINTTAQLLGLLDKFQVYILVFSIVSRFGLSILIMRDVLSKKYKNFSINVLSSDDEPLSMQFSHVIMIWWSFMWKTAIIGSLLGALLGTIFPFLGFFIVYQPLLFQGAILIFLIPVMIFIFKKVLNKKFKNFRIILLEKQ